MERERQREREKERERKRERKREKEREKERDTHTERLFAINQSFIFINSSFAVAKRLMIFLCS